MGAVYLSNDKRHRVDLTMKELFTEYTAVCNEFQNKFDIWLSLPEESNMKKQYEDMMKEWYEEKQKFAVEIADRLTK